MSDRVSRTYNAALKRMADRQIENDKLRRHIAELEAALTTIANMEPHRRRFYKQEVKQIARAALSRKEHSDV